VRRVEVRFWFEELAVVQILVVAVYYHFESAKNTSTQKLCKRFISIFQVTQRPPLKDIVNGLKQAITNCKEP
jgi:hypothetical protein